MSNLKRYTLYIINIIDIISILLSYGIAVFVRRYLFSGITVFVRHTFNIIIRPFHFTSIYNQLLLMIIVAYFLINVLILYNDDQYLKRNNREEFVKVVKMAIYVLIVVAVFLYFLKMGETFSRLFVGVYFGVFTIVDFMLRCIVRKMFIPRYQAMGFAEDVLIVTPMNLVEEVVDQVRNGTDWRYNIAGLVIHDEDHKGETIQGIPVISNVEDMFVDAAEENIDSIMIIQGDVSTSTLRNWMSEFRKLGKIIHIRVKEYELYEAHRTLDTIGDSAVVTYRAFSPMPRRQGLFRRMIDLVLGLLLLPLFLLLTLIVYICSFTETPGHLFVSRVRVGVNSRRFYQYRYRVYRLDAQERVDKGLSPFSWYGKILRTTHLDGAPVLLNILGGEMSFIGPKAPNLPKYLSMSSRYRNLLTIKPGAIGYWSCEEEGEKLYKDQRNYIDSWTILKDLAIIVYMIGRYILGHSLRIDGDTHVQEEFDNLKEIKEFLTPYPYNHSLYKEKPRYLYRIVKRVFDIVFSLIAIIVCSPLFLVISLIVTADDGGAPFYSHQRIGRYGKKIAVFKFRTMRTDAGNVEKLLNTDQLEQYHKEFKVDNDPRVTEIGEALRKSSLDELPQLLNVFSGKMSLIGPRPILEEEFENYNETEIAKLLSVKPGLTGYWQAFARNNAAYETGERQKMEMHYIDHQSLWLDIKIFFKTIVTVFRKEGAQ